MALDVKLFHFLNDLTGKSRLFDISIVFFASYLQYVLVAIFILLLYFSIYSRREKIRIFLAAMTSAIVARFGVTEIIRFFYHRPRPFVVFQIHPLISENDWSFPSGHSAFFFAMATAIYLYNKKWGMGFLIAAILMNVSRIMAGAHYPSDILGGAAIGIVVAWSVFYFVEKKKA